MWRFSTRKTGALPPLNGSNWFMVVEKFLGLLLVCAWAAYDGRCAVVVAWLDTAVSAPDHQWRLFVREVRLRVGLPYGRSAGDVAIIGRGEAIRGVDNNGLGSRVSVWF
jgi:hypothetical protein